MVEQKVAMRDNCLVALKEMMSVDCLAWKRGMMMVVKLVASTEDLSAIK